MEDSFSYSVWAGELGITSKSYLRLLLIGKRSFSERLIPIFTTGLKLNKSSARYFETLARYHTAVTPSAREKYFLELRRLARTSVEFKKLTDAKAFLISPIAPKLQVLLTNHSLCRNVSNLSRLLKASSSETLHALEVLERLSLAERIETKSAEIRWKAKTAFFEVPNNADEESLRIFHRKSLHEAVKAIELPRETRKFDSAFLTLTENQYNSLVTDITEAIDSILSRYATVEEVGSARVHQLNFNVVPVSEPFLQSGESQTAPEGKSEKSLVLTDCESFNEVIL